MRRPAETSALPAQVAPGLGRPALAHAEDVLEGHHVASGVAPHICVAAVENAEDNLIQRRRRQGILDELCSVSYTHLTLPTICSV
eukprot:1228928-Alexandrium_andersonii.AAC.1